MIDYNALSNRFLQEMSFRKDSIRDLAAEWGVSPMTLVNARKGQKLSAELLLRVCIYIGDNPLIYWRGDGGLSYPEDTDARGEVSSEVGYTL